MVDAEKARIQLKGNNNMAPRVGFRKQASKPATKQANKQAGRQAGRQAGTQAGKQANKQASKQPTNHPSRQASHQQWRVWPAVHLGSQLHKGIQAIT